MTALVLEGVSVTYPGSAVPTLRGVDLEVDEGELALVVGRTGSGKSTLLGVVNGTVPHFSGGLLAGRVVVHGRDTRTHRPRDLADVVGVVGQDPLAGFVTDTVEEELAYAMEQLALPAAVMRKRVEETLDVLGIAELRDAPLRELSGGQQQRVAIGSVLTAHPRVLVLDEPTSALDPTGAEEVLAAITRLVHDLGVTVLVAEHRVERVLQYADRVVHVGTDGTVTRRPARRDDARLRRRPAGGGARPAGPGGTRCRCRCATPAAPAPACAPPSATSPRPTCHRLARPRPGLVVTARRRRGCGRRGVVVRHGDVVAVAGVDLDLRPGEVTALMGRNGAGKSSLLWALQGSGTRTSGTVRVGAGDGADPRSLDARSRRAAVGLVPQSAADLLYLDTVAAECAQADRESGAADGTCAALLERIAPGVDPRAPPARPSARGSGSRSSWPSSSPPTRRCCCSTNPRAASTTPPNALCERWSATSPCTAARSLLSTHDVEFVADAADRVVVMAAGEVVADGPTSEVVVSSPAFAPQVAKVTAPGHWLTVDDVRQALPDGAP